jgi:hypothetical protein
MSIIEQLQATIEAKHKEALEALKVLAGYLTGSEANGDLARKSTTNKVKPSQQTGSIRDRVLAAIAEDWATVETIIEQSGLTKKQIRGVLNAPGLSDQIERRSLGEKKEYRYLNQQAKTSASETHKAGARE